MQVVQKLHQILRPFLLRRVKADVEKSLPRKKEIILYATMSAEQEQFQEHLVKRTLEEFLSSTRGSAPGVVISKARLNNVMMQLRKNCNHPDLLSSLYESSYLYPPVETLLEQCGKLRLLDRLLTALRAKGHKVLIFSQVGWSGTGVTGYGCRILRPRASSGSSMGYQYVLEVCAKGYKVLIFSQVGWSGTRVSGVKV